MNPEQLLDALRAGPVAFSEVMQVIDEHYVFTPTAFRNGDVQALTDCLSHKHWWA